MDGVLQWIIPDFGHLIKNFSLPAYHFSLLVSISGAPSFFFASDLKPWLSRRHLSRSDIPRPTYHISHHFTLVLLRSPFFPTLLSALARLLADTED